MFTQDVEAGAQYLDEYYPGWHNRIDLEIDERDLRIIEAKGAMLIENPRKGPTLTERKEMGRRGATWIINEYLRRYKDWYYEKKYENPPFVD